MEIEDTKTFRLEHPQSDILAGFTVHVFTMGCAHNTADSETIASAFMNAGATISEGEKVDIYYVNSCTVKTPSQEKAINQVVRAAKNGKIVVFGGCVPQSANLDPRLLELQRQGKLIVTGVLDDHTLQDIVSRIANALKSESSQQTDAQINRSPIHDPSSLPVYHVNPIVDVIPLCQGCLGCCSYCKTV